MDEQVAGIGQEVQAPRVSIIESITKHLPTISEPKTHLGFKQRLMWTGIILFIFLVLGQITVYGVASTAAERFSFLEMVLGSKLGTLMTLGIGPIVTASIILQLLVGSKIIPWDLKSKQGRAKFMGVQKLMTIFFSIFEAWAYVNFGVVQPIDPSLGMIVMLTGQLAFGGFIVLLMDEVVSKWGIGSGVSLFIAAGVTKTIFVRTLNPLTPLGAEVAAGLIPAFVSYIRLGELSQAFLSMMPLVATIVVFFLVIYIQAIRVDIPLAFASIRGFGRRWPLKFIYTSNMPVILTAALMANLMLVGSMLSNRGISLLGTFDQNGQAVDGFLYFISAPNNVSIQLFMLAWLGITFAGSFIAFYRKKPNIGKITGISAVAGFIAAITLTLFTVGLPLPFDIVRVVGYLIFFMAFCAIFSVIWVSTSGMDAESVAGQIEELGLQIPGFRRDPRIIREILNRYIPTLAILGGLTVGGLAAFADLTNAIGTGTGILLTVMIIYNFYEIIAARYVEEMHPALRGFFK